MCNIAMSNYPKAESEGSTKVPARLCQAVCAGLKNQLDRDEMDVFEIQKVVGYVHDDLTGQLDVVCSA